jgi:hypothetical protein
MGASNYARHNLKKVYAVREEYLDEDLFIDIQEPLVYALDQEFSKSKKIEVSDSEGSDGSRNYTGAYIASITREYDFGILELRCKICNGYYEGANLEYDLFFEGEEYNNIEDIEEYATIIRDYKRMVSGMERVYSKLTEPLTVLGTFSDGTTVYKN